MIRTESAATFRPSIYDKCLMIINFIINNIQSHQLRLGYPIPTRIAHHDGAERDLCYANNDAN